MKKLISVLLVVSMICVMLSAQGFVSYGSTTNAMEDTNPVVSEQKSIWGKDETVSVNQIPEISSELIETVEIKNAGERCYYKFTPTESGAYKYYSDSTYSIYGAIRNSEFKTGAIGDNYETYPIYPYYPVLQGDFGIILMFEAGETYYLESYIDNNRTGTYNIGLVKVPKATAVDISYIGYREYGSEIKFSAKYTPVDCAPESVVSWTSSNPEVLEIDSSGNAFCKGVGTAVVSVTTSSGISATKEIVIEDCDEIKTSEKETYTVLFESNYRYKFVPEVSGVYTFSFDRDSWVFYMVASLKNAQLEEIVSVNDEDDTFDCTLTAGEAYYLEIYANSGDVMCWAYVTAELKEEIVEETISPTNTPTVDHEFEYEILNNGKAAITKYKGTDVSVIIPDELDGYTISSIGAYSFANNENLKNIWIPESVTVIEENAFYETRPGGVFYPGSKEKWDNISIGNGNIYLKAAIHFYNFNSTVPDEDDPVIGLSAFSDIANKNEQYVIRVDAYNLTSLEQAEVILKYNPEVLKLNLYDSVMMYEESLYAGGYKLLSEGNVRIGVSRDENWIQYNADSIIGFNLYFDVVGTGNTDLRVELENANYRSDSQLQVVSSNFAKVVEDSESEPEPTDTICPTEIPTPVPTEDIKPTEEIVATSHPWAPLGDVNIDDIIDAEDALLVLKHAAKLEILTGQSLEVADTTRDGHVDAEDALRILKKAAKLIEEL